MPIGFHPTGNSSLKDDAGQRYVGHANFHPIAHAIRNPVELMGAIASMTTGGILERHPKLRCAFLEGTAGWLHWWLWRLDDQWEKYGPGCENQLTMAPSEYFKRQCYIALDVDEEPAVDVVNKMGAEYFVVSSDYPHADGAFPEAMQQFLGLPLDDEQRRKILWDNCARLYGIPRPAAALTRDAEQGNRGLTLRVAAAAASRRGGIFRPPRHRAHGVVQFMRVRIKDSCMPLPSHLREHLRIPVLGAPMFLVSGPELVIEQCKAGIIGSFPALNARPQEELDRWLTQIEDALAKHRREHPERERRAVRGQPDRQSGQQAARAGHRGRASRTRCRSSSRRSARPPTS